MIQSDCPAEYIQGNYCHHTKEQWVKTISSEQKWNYNLNEISDLISKEFKLHGKKELSASNCNRADFVYWPSKYLEFGLPFHIRFY